MKSLLESTSALMNETIDYNLVEEYFVENIDDISNRVLDMVEDAGLDITEISEEVFDAFLNSAIIESAETLDEGVFGMVASKIGGLFGGAKPLPHNELVNGLRPNPKRLSAQTPSPATVAAKQQVKKRVYLGAQAKKNMLSQLTPEHKQSLGSGKIRSRRHKDGTVRHYFVPHDGGARIHIATSTQSDGDWSHVKHED